MTALYIILAIIFVIWLILFQFVTVDFSFIDKKLKVKVKYLFFTLFDLDKLSDDEEIIEENQKESLDNNKDKKKEKAAAQKAESKADRKDKANSGKKENSKDSAGKQEENKKEKGKKKKKKTLEDKLFDLGDKIEFIKGLYDIGKRPVFKILKGIHLTKLFIDFDIADEDAYDCAIKFGNMNALVFNAIGSLACLFTVKKKSIDIHCVYDKSPPKYDASFYLRLRPTTVIAAAASFGMKYLIYFVIKPRIESRKLKKKKHQNKSAAAKTA